jgi:hypothetical protein
MATLRRRLVRFLESDARLMDYAVPASLIVCALLLTVWFVLLLSSIQEGM